ncbi:MAG: SLBB domain-containing protein [Verrucomicrobiia bacterium]
MRSKSPHLPLLLPLILALSLTHGHAELQPVETKTQPYRLNPLDRIVISPPGTTLTLSQDGTVSIGQRTLRLAGMETNEARALLAPLFPPQASIRFEEFRISKITVLGEVYHQILAEMPEGPMRVLDAIAAANGFTALANRKRVRLIRQNADRIEIYEINVQNIMNGRDVDHNILVEPGDVITVPRNFL